MNTLQNMMNQAVLEEQQRARELQAEYGDDKEHVNANEKDEYGDVKEHVNDTKKKTIDCFEDLFLKNGEKLILKRIKISFNEEMKLFCVGNRILEFSLQKSDTKQETELPRRMVVRYGPHNLPFYSKDITHNNPLSYDDFYNFFVYNTVILKDILGSF